MRTRIYRLKNSVTQDVTLVRASSEANALMAMAREAWSVCVATQDDCVQHGGDIGVFDAPVRPRKKRDAVDQFFRDAGAGLMP